MSKVGENRHFALNQFKYLGLLGGGGGEIPNNRSPRIQMVMQLAYSKLAWISKEQIFHVAKGLSTYHTSYEQLIPTRNSLPPLH